MMRRIATTFAVFVLGCSTIGVSAEPVATAMPGWMAGCWLMAAGPKWVEECWTSPRAGVMLGSSRSGRGDTLQSWEATQILPDKDGRLTYWASPDGAARVAFRMVSRGSADIVFANPAHDYPQRIRYWREKGVLNAEISLADGSKPMRWRYEPIRSNWPVR